MVDDQPVPVPALGRRHLERGAAKIGGNGLCFSPDGRTAGRQDASKVLRLVETETGRTVARLESPDLCACGCATFSPDGSRLAVITNDGPAVHVWDLRAIRRQLAAMGLDWDAPAYSGDDPADPSAPPLPPLQVDLGPLARHTRALHRAPRSAGRAVHRDSRKTPTTPRPTTIAAMPWSNWDDRRGDRRLLRPSACGPTMLTFEPRGEELCKA